MTTSAPGVADRLNSRLAWLLGVGTWASCGLITIGMVFSASGASPRLGAAHFISAGIVLLIALPALRVAMMGVWFLLSRDLDFALVAAFVLAIIIVSTLLGVLPERMFAVGKSCRIGRGVPAHPSGYARRATACAGAPSIDRSCGSWEPFPDRIRHGSAPLMIRPGPQDERCG
jgi:hypothetical protein